MMTSAYNCPRCGSENTSTFPMIHLGGTTKGSFGAVSYGLAAGLVGTKGKTNTQNLLALQTSPPTKPGYAAGDLILGIMVGGTFVLAMVSAFSLFGYVPVPVFSFIIFAAGLACFYYFRSKQVNEKVNEWRQAIQQWENSSMCLKCGNAWTAQTHK